MTKIIIFGIIGILCVYLIGSFYSVSFNIAKWEEVTRGFVSMVFTIIVVWTGMGLIMGVNND